ncbi:MAG TPA: hypothetical protein ENN86_03045, partial [Desulfobacteraceae bacterium]|nr:hypothetical protein [Desulfobacteraceae bacterium]
DNHVVYLPNYYIIAGVNFEDKSNYLASPGLVEYAITRKWYDPASGEFNFREAYGNPGSAESMSNTGRMWMGVNGLSADKYAINDKFPVSFVPARPVKIEDIIHLLANHYEGTHLDDSNNYAEHNPHENKIMNICAGHQQLSFVAELRHDMPVETGCRLWVTHRRGCVHAYMPVYYGIKDFPEEFKYLNDYDDVYQMHIDPPEEVYDRENGKAWWSFLKVTEYVDENYRDRIGERKDLKNKLQQEYFDLASEFDESLDERWKENKARAIDDMTEFNNMIFQKALESNERYLKGR